MHILALTSFVSLAFLLSCSRAPSSSHRAEQKSMEQRVIELEQSSNHGSRSPSEEELKKEADRDLEEIRSMGLVDRALREFRSRFPNATIGTCRISYFVDTNTVWCSIGYRITGKDEAQDDSFGYRRRSGTNWI